MTTILKVCPLLRHPITFRTQFCDPGTPVINVVQKRQIKACVRYDDKLLYWEVVHNGEVVAVRPDLEGALERAVEELL